MPYYSFLSAAREAAAVPRFLDRMVNQSVVEGAPVYFSAEAVGVPTPMMSWQKDGKILSSDNHYQIQQDGPRSSLQIAAARPDDSAWYQCSAVNTAGSASNRARLIVQGVYSYNHLTYNIMVSFKAGVSTHIPHDSYIIIIIIIIIIMNISPRKLIQEPQMGSCSSHLSNKNAVFEMSQNSMMDLSS